MAVKTHLPVRDKWQPWLVSCCLAILVSFTSGLAIAQVSATAVSVRGFVTASGADENVRQLKRGDVVYSGDTISTGSKARVRLAFTDGSTAAILQETTFEIEDYAYSGQIDGTENTDLNLVEGSLEYLSGKIGQDSQDKFRLDTQLATIGLRGTFIKLTVIIPEDPSEPPIVNASTLGGSISFTPVLPQIPGTDPNQQQQEQIIVNAGESVSVTQQTTGTTSVPTVTTGPVTTEERESITITEDGSDNSEVVEQNFQPEVVTQSDQQQAATTETAATETTSPTTTQPAAEQTGASIPKAENLQELIQDPDFQRPCPPGETPIVSQSAPNGTACVPL